MGDIPDKNSDYSTTVVTENTVPGRMSGFRKIEQIPAAQPYSFLKAGKKIGLSQFFHRGHSSCFEPIISLGNGASTIEIGFE